MEDKIISSEKMRSIIQKIGLLAAMLQTVITASAYDFEVDGLNYFICSYNDRTVAVSHFNKVNGDLVIPQRIIYSGETYSVISISQYAFYNCTGLTSVEIPSSVKTIGDSSFESCINLIDINVNDENASFCSINGILYSKDASLLIQCGGGKNGDISLPNSVTTIGEYAFSGCSRLTSVAISNSVTTIGEYAFSSCNSLTSVTIPSSVTTIGKGAFSGCSSLTSVEIPNSVTTIKYKTFSGCNSLTTVEIPNSVREIESYAFLESGLTSVTIGNSVSSINSSFDGCSNLTEINVSKENNYFCSIDGILYSKDASVLKRCGEGKKGEIMIPNSVTKIWSSAFYNCSGLTTVTIPDQVDNSFFDIGSYAFWYCSGLTSVTLPSSYVTIGDRALFGCTSLAEIYCKPETPPMVAFAEIYGSFSYQTFMNAKLYVPVGCKSEYEKVVPWRDFRNIEEMDFTSSIGEVVAGGDVEVSVSDGVITLSGNDEGATVEIFDMQGRKVFGGVGNVSASLPAGVYIVCTAGKTLKARI